MRYGSGSTACRLPNRRGDATMRAIRWATAKPEIAPNRDAVKMGEHENRVRRMYNGQWIRVCLGRDEFSARMESIEQEAGLPGATPPA